jgi:EPS-associated MarR family transcriptional regulator
MTGFSRNSEIRQEVSSEHRGGSGARHPHVTIRLSRVVVSPGRTAPEGLTPCICNLCSSVEQTFRAQARPAMLVPDYSILRVLRLLDASPRLTQREMARELGVSLGKANYCLRALLGKGFVKVQNFRKSTNKRGYVYLLTAEGVAAKANLTRHFLARKREEYDALRLEVERLQRESESAVEVP